MPNIATNRGKQDSPKNEFPRGNGGMSLTLKTTNMKLIRLGY